MDLVEDLGVDNGLTAMVGAGGKKTAIYTMAERIRRAVITQTVRIPPFDDHVERVIRTADPAAALDSVPAWPVGLVPDYEDSRYLGYEPGEVDAIAERNLADAVLVKADGARNREFKAPGEDEPRIPPGVDRVLLLASTQIVGFPLSEPHVHRPGRVAALTGLSVGDQIGVEDVATVLASPLGGGKNVPEDAELIPVLNKVDETGDEAIARDIATAILDRVGSQPNEGTDAPPIHRVALTRLIDADRPLVDIVE